MTVINNVDDTKFSLDGIQYPKKFSSFVAGDSIEIFNAFDRRFSLFPFKNYTQITLNGVVHTSVANLQAALIPVIFVLGGGGGSGSNIPTIIVNGNRFFLIKHPDNDDPQNVSTLELNDMIMSGYWDNTELWIAARYQTVGDVNVKTNWEIIGRELNIAIS